MGLDLYVFKKSINSNGISREIAYWCKDWGMFEKFRDIHTSKYSDTGDYNCVETPLDIEDVINLIEQVKQEYFMGLLDSGFKGCHDTLGQLESLKEDMLSNTESTYYAYAWY